MSYCDSIIEIRERKRRKESERMSCRATEHVAPGNTACPVREQAVLMEGQDALGFEKLDLKSNPWGPLRAGQLVAPATQPHRDVSADKANHDDCAYYVVHCLC